MLRSVVCLLITCAVSLSSWSLGQQRQSDAGSLPSLEEILKKAASRRAEYIATFKELHAEETQRLEEYDDNGLKKRREVVSDLIIYESPLDKKVVAEYRNIRSVDGKAISGRDQRAEELFSRLAKSKSLRQELERIDKESRRFDLNTSFYNYTLLQGAPLAESRSAHFRFTITGTEQIDGHESIVLQYQQLSAVPGDSDQLKVPKRFAGAVGRDRGRLWLDRDTLRLRREEKELTMEHPTLKSPLTIVKFEMNYTDSPFGILTPTRIAMTTFPRGRDRADGTPELLIGGKVIFEYGTFRRFDVSSDYRGTQ